MSIEAVKHIGFFYSGEVILLQAGKVKYKEVPEEFTDELIDGTNVYEHLWSHLEFTVFYGYLGQQILDSEAPQSIITALSLLNPSLTVWNTKFEIDSIMNGLKSRAVTFFPMLEDEFGNVNTTNYEVVPDSASYTFLDSGHQGRFPGYSPLKFKTKNPITTTPNWIR